MGKLITNLIYCVVTWLEKWQNRKGVCPVTHKKVSEMMCCKVVFICFMCVCACTCACVCQAGVWRSGGTAGVWRSGGAGWCSPSMCSSGTDEVSGRWQVLLPSIRAVSWPLVLVYWDRILHYSTSNMAILLPLPPVCWDCRCVAPHQIP